MDNGESKEAAMVGMTITHTKQQNYVRGNVIVGVSCSCSVVVPLSRVVNNRIQLCIHLSSCHYSLPVLVVVCVCSLFCFFSNSFFFLSIHTPPVSFVNIQLDVLITHSVCFFLVFFC